MNLPRALLTAAHSRLSALMASSHSESLFEAVLVAEAELASEAGPPKPLSKSDIWLNVRAQNMSLAPRLPFMRSGEAHEHETLVFAMEMVVESFIFLTK